MAEEGEQSEPESSAGFSSPDEAEAPTCSGIVPSSPSEVGSAWSSQESGARFAARATPGADPGGLASELAAAPDPAAPLGLPEEAAGPGPVLAEDAAPCSTASSAAGNSRASERCNCWSPRRTGKDRFLHRRR